MNSLTPPLKQKLIKSTIADFSLRRGIFEYKEENSNVETEVYFLNLLYLLHR